MADRQDGRNVSHRAFRPTLDGDLESRLLMARFMEVRIFPLPHPGNIQTGFNGSAVLLTNQQGQSFYVDVAGQGTVRAYSMSGGRFGLILDGTDVTSSLTINPALDVKSKGVAHRFNTRQAGYNGLLNIGAITVDNGTIGSILGYKTAVLSGPLTATGTSTVDRIAFDMLVPGATINVGGNLNTLDIYNSAQLIGAGTGILVGQDLNSMTTSGDLDIGNGAVVSIGRDIGHSTQPAKGTGPANIGMTIGGNIVIFGGSKLAVGRYSQFPAADVPSNPIVANSSTTTVVQTSTSAATGYLPGINVTGNILGASNILARSLTFPAPAPNPPVVVPPFMALGLILP